MSKAVLWRVCIALLSTYASNHGVCYGKNRSEKQFVSSKIDEVKVGTIFLNVFRLVLDQYVDPIGPHEMQKMLEGAIQGALSSLDPHSGVIPQNVLTEMEGEFGGLGVQVCPISVKGTDRTELTIVAVLEGTPKTPAEIAGLKPKDVILSVDNTFYDRYDEAVKKMRGAPGTKVSLRIKRKVGGKEKIFQTVLTRAIIKTDSVKFRLEPNSNVGYIRISVFDAKTSTLVAKALRELYKMNPKINSIVIDLRNNYGGFIDQAIKVVSFFVSSGVVVKVKDRKHIRVHDVIPNQLIVGKNGLYDAALVVLVNGYSASASEIVAGALKDHNRAIIVGKPTFGKGSVQEVRTLDPYLSFKFTTSRFYSPKGSPIQGAGIFPHVVLKSLSNKNSSDLEIKESNLPGSLERKLLEEKSDTNSLRKKEQKPSSHFFHNLLPNTQLCSAQFPLLSSLDQEEIPKEQPEPEIDYELLQAIDLAKALGAQFEHLSKSQQREKKK